MSALRRGHRRGEEPDGPAIRIARLPGAPDAALRELLAGVEEEGVPALVADDDGRALTAAAHAAAAASTLRVGVAVGPQAACATLSRLPEDAPLLRRERPDADALRRLGQDAARLVKTVPLTDHPTDRSPV
jgi:predicted O-methyltransferase YrrM